MLQQAHDSSRNNKQKSYIKRLARYSCTAHKHALQP